MSLYNETRVTDILFARDWQLDRTIAYMEHYVPLTYKIAVAYVVAVFAGQRLMRSQKALELDGILAVWNALFSVFSGLAAWHLVPELISVIREFGFVGSYCEESQYYTASETGYWGWLFVMSKLPELGDTLFLILRKRNVIFMHWYHHALTFVYAAITYSTRSAWARWSLALNLIVHTVMYMYFAIRALSIKTPRWVAQFITTIQIVQFVISCYIFGHLVLINAFDLQPGCRCSLDVLWIGGAMYLSYLYLFAAFFYKAYIKKQSPTKHTKAE